MDVNTRFKPRSFYNSAWCSGTVLTPWTFCCAPSDDNEQFSWEMPMRKFEPVHTALLDFTFSSSQQWSSIDPCQWSSVIWKTVPPTLHSSFWTMDSWNHLLTDFWLNLSFESTFVDWLLPTASIRSSITYLLLSLSPPPTHLYSKQD